MERRGDVPPLREGSGADQEPLSIDIAGVDQQASEGWRNGDGGGAHGCHWGASLLGNDSISVNDPKRPKIIQDGETTAIIMIPSTRVKRTDAREEPPVFRLQVGAAGHDSRLCGHWSYSPNLRPLGVYRGWPSSA